MYAPTARNFMYKHSFVKFKTLLFRLSFVEMLKRDWIYLEDYRQRVYAQYSECYNNDDVIDWRIKFSKASYNLIANKRVTFSSFFLDA